MLGGLQAFNLTVSEMDEHLRRAGTTLCSLQGHLAPIMKAVVACLNLIFCRENAAGLQKRGFCTVFYIPEGTGADGIWTQRSTPKTRHSRVSDEFGDPGSQGYAVPFFTKPSCHAVTHPCMNSCHRS